MRSVRKIFDVLESCDEGLPVSSPSCPLCPSVSHVLSPPQETLTRRPSSWSP